MGITPLDYDAWRRTTLGRVTERLEHAAVLDLAGSLTGVDVLDVGCGDGAYVVEAARAGARVAGLDRSEAAVRAAQARLRTAGLPADLRVADALALPFPPDRFDVVLAVTVLCFVPDVGGALREMARVLRPGGVLVVGELGKWSLWGASRRLRGLAGSATWRTAHLWSPGELRARLHRAGLEPEGQRGAAFYPPSGAVARGAEHLDRWIGRLWSLGAAFVAVAARKPRS